MNRRIQPTPETYVVLDVISTVPRSSFTLSCRTKSRHLLIIPSADNGQRFLDFARNDKPAKWERLPPIIQLALVQQ